LKSGIEACYVIVGKRGWLANALGTRLKEHAEFGRRLFWIEKCNDTDLHYLYRHATAVIQPSIAEGFGLPIVEAAHFGAPVIASDIRIFHEVGGQSISYFDPMDSEALAKRLTEALKGPRVAPSIVTSTTGARWLYRGAVRKRRRRRLAGARPSWSRCTWQLARAIHGGA
jgi:glycosyltransferase involved in cell wall biosynthesis